MFEQAGATGINLPEHDLKLARFSRSIEASTSLGGLAPPNQNLQGLQAFQLPRCLLRRERPYEAIDPRASAVHEIPYAEASYGFSHCNLRRSETPEQILRDLPATLSACREPSSELP